jgi:DNA-binding XRE family transcriptional regulator
LIILQRFTAQLDCDQSKQQLMRLWRQDMGMTQTELGELLGYCVFYVNHIERGANTVADHTWKHLSLIYSVHSLPPDAPVSILQEMLIPPTLAAKRAKAAERLKRRKAKDAKKKRQSTQAPSKSSKSGRQA